MSSKLEWDRKIGENGGFKPISTLMVKTGILTHPSQDQRIGGNKLHRVSRIQKLISYSGVSVKVQACHQTRD
jgi:hypothetical protein